MTNYRLKIGSELRHRLMDGRRQRNFKEEQQGKVLYPFSRIPPTRLSSKSTVKQTLLLVTRSSNPSSKKSPKGVFNSRRSRSREQYLQRYKTCHLLSNLLNLTVSLTNSYHSLEKKLQIFLLMASDQSKMKWL